MWNISLYWCLEWKIQKCDNPKPGLSQCVNTKGNNCNNNKNNNTVYRHTEISYQATDILKSKLMITDQHIIQINICIDIYLRCLTHIRTIFWPISPQLSDRLASFTQPPQTGTENRLILPRGITGSVNYSNSITINSYTGVQLVSTACVSSQTVIKL